MVTITREEQLPIVKIIIAAALTRTISFPDEFFGEAIDLRITNLDAAASSTYQMDGESQPVITLAPNSFVTFGATRVRLLTIVAAAGGNCQVEATVRTIPSIREP